jgi:hypothetical protein
VLSGIPASIDVPATGAGGATVSFTAPASADLVDGPVPVACTPASGSLFPVGTTTVTCTATDAHGNRATATFTVTVHALPVVTARLVSLSKGGDDESTQSFRVVFSATDPAGIRSLTATLNGVAVTNGQIVTLKLAKKGAQKVTREDGRLQIQALSFLLTVSATDNAGGSATATAAPVFVTRGHDGHDGNDGNNGKNGKND